MAEQAGHLGPVMPYGVPIRQAIADGDLDAMKQVRDAAERWLSEHGDLAGALEVLKAEIARKQSAG